MKRRFNIYISVKTDDKGVTYARLANMEPIRYEGNDMLNAIVGDVCKSLMVIKYPTEGYPSAKAVPSAKAKYNKQFGEKLARKRVLRQVYRDVMTELENHMIAISDAVENLYTVFNYASSKHGSIKHQIDNMYGIAAVAEGDVNVTEGDK